MNWLTNPGGLAAERERGHATRIGRLLLIGMLVCTTLGLWAPTRAHAGDSGSGPSIDLSTDQNKDGIPDDLAAAIDVVAAAEDKEAAIKDLVSRLPYSEETRALQQQAEALHTELEETTDPSEAEQINGEILELNKRMEADPSYITAVEAVTSMIAPEAEVTTESVYWDILHPGDIMLHRDYLHPTSYLFGFYNHTGNYHGDGLVFESDSQGVALHPIARNWQGGVKYTSFAFNNARLEPEVVSAMEYREGQYGTNGSRPYNYWFPDKNTDARLYCAQLTWKIHMGTGVNLDSNHWLYQLNMAVRYGPWVLLVTIPAVAPDEIALSPHVSIYSNGWA